MNALLEIEAVDAFAGPGGWDAALRALDIDPLGIEWDDAACATRAAADLRTLQADVADLDPLDFAPCDLFIASPPCPTFSRAGKGDGIADMPLVYEAASAIDAGEPIPDLDWRDERSALVVQPLRWVLALEPTYIAWEQVPDVLPFWEFCAGILRERGWSVWTGVLEAERYGVPQTRKRAILMASKAGVVHPPRPTHQRYVKGELQRHDVTMEGEVLPWVSMAEALGWGMTGRPCGTVVTPHGGGPESGALDGGSGQRKAMADAQEQGDWKLRSGQSVAGGDRAERDAGEPCVTITSRADNNAWIGQARDSGPGAEREPRSADEPSYTLRAGGSGSHPSGVRWVGERPATTVCGDPRLSPPGYRGAPSDYAEDGTYQGERSMDNAVRVSLEEVATLQTFPPDYPFQGSKSKRFEQCGNAVPPLLAHAILSALLAPALSASSSTRKAA